MIAPSYGGLYFRNAFNVGLLLLTCAAAPSASTTASASRSTPAPAASRAPTASVLACDPIPAFLLDMVEAGGLLPQLQTTPATEDPAMSTTPEFDLLIKNVRVVRPHGNAVHAADIAIAGGKFAQVAPGIDAARAKAVHDGRGRLAFPGVVDAHMHSGIYSPLDEDAVSESKAAAMGGVTSSLNYFRTGQYYLNKGGPYKKFFPEVLKISQGPLPRRLRLPPRADGPHAHRRDRRC